MIIQGDCLEIMKTFPDKSFDLILTDPPYGIGESNEKNSTRGCLAKTTNFNHYSWDKEKISPKYFIEMFRVSKNQIVFGGNYYANLFPPSSCWLVWDKDNGETDFADCELAWTSFNTAVRKFKWRWQGMLQEKGGKEKEFRLHPTQKPVALMKWILDKYTKEGDKILDCFMGSGTTGVACALMGREFTGIELDAGYCEIAERRIKHALSQGTLFNYNQTIKEKP